MPIYEYIVFINGKEATRTTRKSSLYGWKLYAKQSNVEYSVEKRVINYA